MDEEIGQIVDDVLQVFDGGVSDNKKMLLMGTIAHESGGGKYRRQLGYDDDSLGGAFGLVQMELVPAQDHFDYMERRGHVWTKFRAGWIGEDDGLPFYTPSNRDMADLLMGSDNFAISLMRVHYWRKPEAVPHGLEAVARYYKKMYNTELGKATPEQFIEDYRRYVDSLA